MLRRELIEIINSGSAWAFIGSGTSIDAGGPSWSDLVARIVESADESVRTSIETNRHYSAALARSDYPDALELIEAHIGRAAVEKAVRQTLKPLSQPSAIVRQLAQWPFAGYITTNYDDLLWKALTHAGAKGWSRVGNTADEIKQISGEASRLIWHVHGGVELEGAQSTLILTRADYASIYPGSAVLDQLRALLSLRRIVFVGFGFRDADLLKQLRTVGALTDPARPLFAMVPMAGSKAASTRDELRKHYNIQTIPYVQVGESHTQLERLLGSYGVLVVKRSLQLKKPLTTAPSYDPETTGLLVYNELRLQQGIDSKAIREVLIRSRILAHLKHNGPATRDTLMADIAARAASVVGQEKARQATESEVAGIVDQLLAESLVQMVKQDSTQLVELDSKGVALVDNHAATGSRLARQFRDSLTARASALLTEAAAAKRVASVAERFVRDCIRRRALGVAMAAMAWGEQQQAFQMVALLQALPDFMAELTTVDEAVALESVVQDVLTSPSEAEETYVGLTLQAVFGVHLLGYDAKTLAVRSDLFKGSALLLDATLLIELLAEGSMGHSFATALVARLMELGATLVTTGLLVDEVAEHARWALGRVDPVSGAPSLETYMAATGKSGDRPNEFLLGFLECLAAGECGPSMHRYLEKALKHRLAVDGRCSKDDVRRALQAIGIESMDFDRWQGVDTDLVAERARTKDEVAKRRIAAGSYTHDRQVTAEAEAALLIRGLRNGSIRLGGKKYDGAYFLTQTRAIDDVVDSPLPLGMRPQAAMQWSATLRPCSVDELRVLTTNLLSELERTDVAVVDRAKLQLVFQPLISAARHELAEVRERHKTLLARRYGTEAGDHLLHVDALDAPDVLDTFNSQRLGQLEAVVNRQAERIADVERKAALTAKDREELERLRQAARQRRMKAKSQKRSAATKQRKRRKSG